LLRTRRDLVPARTAAGREGQREDRAPHAATP